MMTTKVDAVCLAMLFLAPCVQLRGAVASFKQNLFTRRDVLDLGPSGPAAFALPAASVIQCSLICLGTPDCTRFCHLLSTGTCYLHPQNSVQGAVCYRGQESCPVYAGYSLDDGVCARVDETASDHATGQTVCTAEGGHLYDSHTDADMAVLDRLVNAHMSLGGVNNCHYVGATLGLGGDFVWTDGAELSADSTMWGNDEPNGAGGENCVIIFGGGDRFHDAPCDYVCGFVCQIDP